MMSQIEEEAYEIATREVAEKSFVTSVWGKAFSESLGDQKIAVALYIKLRAEQLMQQRHQEASNRMESEIQLAFKNMIKGLGFAILVILVLGLILTLLRR